jgi:hypothetical protein
MDPIQSRTSKQYVLLLAVLLRITRAEILVHKNMKNGNIDCGIDSECKDTVGIMFGQVYVLEIHQSSVIIIKL